MIFIFAGSLLTGVYLLVYLVVSHSARRSLGTPLKKIPMGSSMDLPMVSVIVAVRNEASNLPGLLQHLLRQQYPWSRVEYIIADDHSEDQSAEVVADFLHLHPDIPLRFILAAGNDPPGKKSALERGLRHASGSFILTTDGDTALKPAWVYSMVDRFNDDCVKMVLGPVFFTPSGNLLQRLLSIEFLGIMGATCGFAGLGHPVMCNGANLAFRREAFNETGGYSTNIRFTSGDDQFLMMAIRRRYGRCSVAFCAEPEVIVTTEAPAHMKAFFNQRLRWLSKSRGYRAGSVIAAGFLTALPLLVIFSGLVAGFILFDLKLILITQVWMVIKMSVDYSLVSGMARFSGDRLNLWYFILAQYLQMAYAPVTGMASLFYKGRWKGRTIG